MPMQRLCDLIDEVLDLPSPSALAGAVPDRDVDRLPERLVWAQQQLSLIGIELSPRRRRHSAVPRRPVRTRRRPAKSSGAGDAA
jgi:hypothetical protein